MNKADITLIQLTAGLCVVFFLLGLLTYQLYTVSLLGNSSDGVQSALISEQCGHYDQSTGDFIIINLLKD